MKAARLTTRGRLEIDDDAVPVPGATQVLLKVLACGLCRTDIHLIDGELANPKPGVIPGHQIVGIVEKTGHAVHQVELGARVGVAWLGKSCQSCRFCRTGRENLCEAALFTGYTCDGGFSEYALAQADYLVPIPKAYDAAHAAPLLCAGLIGYRALRFCGDAKRLGLYGFGAAAHLICQVALAQGRAVYAFTRPFDLAAQNLAKRLGATWQGGSDETPPEPLDAAIVFAPVGALVPKALGDVDKGGTVVTAGIHMSDIPTFPYELLWHERTLRSVANLTREDAKLFMDIAATVPLHTEVHRYTLAQVNQAVDDLRSGRFAGAAVITL